MPSQTWTWDGPAERRSHTGRNHYQRAINHDQRSATQRVFNVGDAVITTNDDNEVMYAHIIDLYDDQLRATPGSATSPTRMRCVLRWFYGPDDVPDLKLPTDHLLFSDHIEPGGTNPVYVLTGFVWLFQNDEDATAFRKDPSSRYNPTTDEVKVVGRYLDIDFWPDLKTRKLHSDELSELLDCPSNKAFYATGPPGYEKPSRKKRRASSRSHSKRPNLSKPEVRDSKISKRRRRSTRRDTFVVSTDSDDVSHDHITPAAPSSSRKRGAPVSEELGSDLDPLDAQNHRATPSTRRGQSAKRRKIHGQGVSTGDNVGNVLEVELNSQARRGRRLRIVLSEEDSADGLDMDADFDGELVTHEAHAGAFSSGAVTVMPSSVSPDPVIAGDDAGPTATNPILHQASSQTSVAAPTAVGKLPRDERGVGAFALGSSRRHGRNTVGTISGDRLDESTSVDDLTLNAIETGASPGSAVPQVEDVTDLQVTALPDVTGTDDAGVDLTIDENEAGGIEIEEAAAPLTEWGRRSEEVEIGRGGRGVFQANKRRTASGELRTEVERRRAMEANTKKIERGVRVKQESVVEGPRVEVKKRRKGGATANREVEKALQESVRELVEMYDGLSESNRALVDLNIAGVWQSFTELAEADLAEQ